MDSWGGSGDEGDGKCGEGMKTGLKRVFQAEGISARLVRLGTFCGHEQEARCGGGGGCKSKPPRAEPSLHHGQHTCQ